MLIKCRPELRISATYSDCFAVNLLGIPASNSSENPMIAFKGVRSSWLVLAKNSVLARFAYSALSVAARSFGPC